MNDGDRSGLHERCGFISGNLTNRCLAASFEQAAKAVPAGGEGEQGGHQEQGKRADHSGSIAVGLGAPGWEN